MHRTSSLHPLRRWLLSLLLCSPALAAAMPQPPPGAAANLARMTLTLSRDEPYRFRLHYHGPTMPFRGPLCYAFAGYNETCFDLDLDWLTPATTIDLHAPGGVPRDFLEGYMMLVRYPAMAARTYRYALEGQASGAPP